MNIHRRGREERWIEPQLRIDSRHIEVGCARLVCGIESQVWSRIARRAFALVVLGDCRFGHADRARWEYIDPWWIDGGRPK